MGKRWLRMLAVCSCVTIGASVVLAQDMASFEKRTTVKVLPNGLTIIVCERPEAPVFSFFTEVNAGSANDPGGQSGLAHMFEHMAFKGTQEIGTTNYPAEKVALAKVEIAYKDYDAEHRKRVGQDQAKLAQLKKVFEDAKADAQQYVIPNAFPQLAEQNGEEGLNASTAEDTTQYFWSMPSNRLELWAYMESGRIGEPVEREFYKERDVVQEERRMRHRLIANGAPGGNRCWRPRMSRTLMGAAASAGRAKSRRFPRLRLKHSTPSTMSLRTSLSPSSAT